MIIYCKIVRIEYINNSNLIGIIFHLANKTSLQFIIHNHDNNCFIDCTKNINKSYIYTMTMEDNSIFDYYHFTFNIKTD
jgi:hypothetical protein